MDISEQISADLEELEYKIVALKSFQQSAITSQNSNDNLTVNYSISSITGQITELVRKLKSNISKLPSKSKDEEEIKKYFYGNLSDKIHDIRQSHTLFLKTDKNVNSNDALIENDAVFSKLQIQKMEETSLLIDQRSENIRHIGKSIQELAQIMSDIRLLTLEQGEQLITIDKSVEAACIDVEKGTKELVKANHSQKSKRKCLCCSILLISLAIMITLFIITLVFKIEKKF